MDEGGEREAERKAIAAKVIGKPSKKMVKKHGDLLQWMKA